MLQKQSEAFHAFLWHFFKFKTDFFAYRSSKESDCIFEIHHLWQAGFSRVYSNCYRSCSFKLEIIKIGQLSHKMQSNNILNFQKSMTVLNAHTKKRLETYRMHLVPVYICNDMSIFIYIMGVEKLSRLKLYLTREQWRKFSFLTSCRTKANEPSLPTICPYLKRRTDGSMTFRKDLHKLKPDQLRLQFEQGPQILFPTSIIGMLNTHLLNSI